MPTPKKTKKEIKMRAWAGIVNGKVNNGWIINADEKSSISVKDQLL